MNALDKSYIERHYHLSWGDGWHRSPVFGLPVLKPESYIPDRLIPFDKINDAQETNYDICFEALPRHSVIFVSTVGSVRSAESRKYFTMGIREMTARLEPTAIILYGPVPALDFDIPVVRHFDRISPAHFNSYQPSLI